ncbi:peptidylprolyl isomerase [Haploplasma axanthum]|uniref:Peptidyl-prolyl cis-trans isomerase n=1 Tax=Haploplasma axanthum TaxID=29552 RepID=A0A449BDZ5_HAPAX|nr:peptidylprolyl isomerase [Haploplasma axanthum]VEU80652.1 Peptidyl-prolyl cis-trans isomerase A precursor [Haploplasma axanthum]
MKKLLIIFVLFSFILTGCSKGKNNPVVTIKVKGYDEVIKIELYREIAPITVENFIDIATTGYYEGSTFHRVIKDFMIQGGQGKTSLKPIKGEFASNGVKNDLKHVRGVISMARTNVKDSATSQFFIVHKDSPHLDGEYAAFGMMIEGFETLDLIANIQTDFNDMPVVSIVIEKVEVKL